jgi:lysophospholipase L1-like esterase
MATTTIAGTGTTSIAGANRAAVVQPSPANYLLIFGDSKSHVAGSVTWLPQASGQAEYRAGPGWTYVDAGVSGATVVSTVTGIAAILAAMPAAAGARTITALINLGVNDLNTALPAEAIWEANYLAILDAIVAKWPTARVWVMRPWKQGFDANCDVLAGWIATLVAARPAFVALGPDERIFYKAADNGVANTTDGIHPSVAGNVAIVAAWQALLWP